MDFKTVVTLSTNTPPTLINVPFLCIKSERRFDVPEFSELHELLSNEVRMVPELPTTTNFTDSYCEVLLFFVSESFFAHTVIKIIKMMNPNTAFNLFFKVTLLSSYN